MIYKIPAWQLVAVIVTLFSSGSFAQEGCTKELDCGQIFIADYQACECVPFPGYEDEFMYDEYYSTQPLCRRMPAPGFELRPPCRDIPIRGKENDPMYNEWFEENGGRPGPCDNSCQYPDYEQHRYKCECVPPIGQENDGKYVQYWFDILCDIIKNDRQNPRWQKPDLQEETIPEETILRWSDLKYRPEPSVQCFSSCPAGSVQALDSCDCLTYECNRKCFDESYLDLSKDNYCECVKEEIVCDVCPEGMRPGKEPCSCIQNELDPICGLKCPDGMIPSEDRCECYDPCLYSCPKDTVRIVGSCLCFPINEDNDEVKKVCDIKCENEYFLIDSASCKCVKVPEFIQYPQYETRWIEEPQYYDFEKLLDPEPEPSPSPPKYKKPKCIPILQSCF